MLFDIKFIALLAIRNRHAVLYIFQIYVYLYFTILNWQKMLENYAKWTSFHKENIRKICICFNQSKTLREQSSHGETTISLGYVIFTLGTVPIGGSTSLFNNPSQPCESVMYCNLTYYSTALHLPSLRMALQTTEEL